VSDASKGSALGPVGGGWGYLLLMGEPLKTALIAAYLAVKLMSGVGPAEQVKVVLSQHSAARSI
jgi:hypothetical protein